jgi:hypothetical protein
MEENYHTLALSSSPGANHSPTSTPAFSPSEGCPIIDLPALPSALLTELNDEMKAREMLQHWQNIGKDDDMSLSWSSSILSIVLERSWVFDQGRYFIPLMSWNAGREYIKGFDEDESKLLKDGIQKALEKGDWSDFIAHRSYYFSLNDIIGVNGDHSENSS